MTPIQKIVAVEWTGVVPLGAGGISFTCGFCGTHTTAANGYHNLKGFTFLVPCTACGHASTIRSGATRSQFPLPAPGREIQHLPPSVHSIYEETRAALRAGTNIGAALLLRVLLFRVAEDHKVPHHKNGNAPTYQACIEHLVSEGLIAPRSAGWVDRVRTLGNEANHEILDVPRDDVEHAFQFMVHVLQAIYEHPALVKPNPMVVG